MLMLSHASSLLMMTCGSRPVAEGQWRGQGTWCECSSWSLRSFLLLTASCKYLLACREGPLSSTHPVEQASNDRAAPYWLGASQLEAARASPTVGQDPWHAFLRQSVGA